MDPGFNIKPCFFMSVHLDFKLWPGVQQNNIDFHRSLPGPETMDPGFNISTWLFPSVYPDFLVGSMGSTKQH